MPLLSNGKIIMLIGNRVGKWNKKNSSDHFKDVFERNLRSPKDIDICVGFCGVDLLKKYSARFIKIAASGKRIRLIFGMYSHAGSFPKALYAELLTLQSAFQKTSSKSCVYICTKSYHGKIYDFGEEVWLGSSNFSRTGFKDQLEAIVKIKDDQTISQIRNYVNDLCSSGNSVSVNNVVLSGPIRRTLPTLKQYSRLPHNLVADHVSMSLPLRVEVQPESGLNLSRGKGRINAKGKYIPRPWYEVEISSDEVTRADPAYPKTANTATTIKHQKTQNQCEFRALLYDGICYRECLMQTYGDYNKAMGTTPRTILGEFLKGQLEKARILHCPEAVTVEMLIAYGRRDVTLTRYTDTSLPKSSDLRDKVYVLDFSRPSVSSTTPSTVGILNPEDDESEENES